MKQIPFADAEYAGKRKQTRRERFLIELDQVVPSKGLVRSSNRTLFSQLIAWRYGNIRDLD